MLRRSFVLTLVAASAFRSASAACAVKSLTTVPLMPAGGVTAVPLEINGVTSHFILDTGAQRSVVAEDSVARLGLARDVWAGTTMSGIGGVDRRPNALPRTLSLGGVPLTRATLRHDTSLTVSPLLRGRPAGAGIDGLLGRDFLSRFDLDLDFPSQRLTLFSVGDCAGRFLPWSSSYWDVPLSMPADTAPVVPVQLDEVSLWAMIDTGATRSMLSARGMAGMHLPVGSFPEDRPVNVSGLGPRVVVMREHRFRDLRVGNDVSDQPLIWVAPVRIVPIVDMLLGMDWLSGRRIWLSFSSRKLFVSS